MSKDAVDILLDSEEAKEGRFCLDIYGECPVCHSSWDGGSIFETLLQQREDGVESWKGMTDEEIRESVEGWASEKIQSFLDTISDEDLKSSIEATMGRAFNSHWVKKYAMTYDANMSAEERRSFVNNMNRDGLHTLLFENFHVYIKGSYSPPYRWSRLVGIEDRNIYDGISYWQCPDCVARWSRWTGRRIDTI